MSKAMGILRSVMVVVSLVVALLVVHAVCPNVVGAEIVPEDQWDDTTKLWLARSVLGEAGWRRFDEYSAIAWVYQTRAEQTDRYNFLEMVRAYSAAVKTGNHHRNPWLFELGLDIARPKTWPVSEDGTGPMWRGLHDKAWSETLTWVDEWQAGEHENPCKGANHYGGYVDRHRATAARWVRIKCSVKTRNRFYTSLKLTRKRM